VADQPSSNRKSRFETIDGGEKWGTLTAIDLEATGKILWQQKTDDPLIGGVLATAGGLVFRISGGGEGRCGASSSSDFFRSSRLVRA
jgi:hypothetical protein